MSPRDPSSSPDPLLILVDEEDRELGFERRSLCHDGEGRLHRAFSIYLSDAEGRLLLQRRSLEKRLWGGSWSNSCCGHPEKGESTEAAASRRLEEELGVSVPLELVFKYPYHASFGEEGSERELCSVFVGRLDAERLRPDPAEVMEWGWLSPREIEEALAGGRDCTPWFRIAWSTLSRSWPS